MEIICLYIFINRRRYSEKDTRQNRTGSTPFGYKSACGYQKTAFSPNFSRGESGLVFCVLVN